MVVVSITTRKDDVPVRAPRPCRRPACRHLSRDGTGYCREHIKYANRWNENGWQDRRGSRHERGYGTKWDKLRAWILKRDKNLCQPCLKKGTLTPAQAVDHIVPKAFGGNDAPSNLQGICHACHKLKSAQEGQAGRHR